MELRRFQRAPLDQPLLYALKGEDAFVDGVGKDISLGGMFIETELPAPFNAEITVHTPIPGVDGELVLPGIVRWTRSDGMGVQFRELGARETYAITEFVRARPR